ncbi:cutinase family protein [Nocardia sp. CDC159]|uniref:Cutinase family protein n=1 Tax=Nocardia pulmonis TaxID=2951408 RepID=A0A9X2E224_9NOCA|nr:MULTISPECIES: cutinase family protein [Nocardia]MCM6772160.1 cutinase family protein [Nocardia pulmonis]MCM6785182.1 cutinase family protein [Nocardia sp. CDC159]
MGDRKVLSPRSRRIPWVFAAALILVGMLYPTPPARAQWCAAVDVVVARGTGEPGHLGSEVGDPFYAVLRDRLPMSTSAYRVNYPADLTDSLSIGRGSADLVAHLAHQAAVCPGQRFVLVGYSQGAAVVHTALGTGVTLDVPGAVRAGGELGGRIAAVLLFGDPLRLIGWHLPDAYLWRSGNYCTPGDPVCAGGMNPAAHVAYGGDFVAAATLAADQL